MDHWLTNILVLTLWLECKGEDRVIQTRGDVIATEGLTVILGCTFETTDTNPSLFWYKQQSNDSPRFMLKRTSYGGDNAAEFNKDRFDAQIQSTSVPLRIQNLQLSDSALYYCALNTGIQKIIFGRGTRLTVVSGEQYNPSYYKLERENTKACLAKDFTSNDATNGTEPFEDASEASRAPDEPFYSQVAVYTGNQTCGGDDVLCEGGFEPDEKVNSLSLIMLGLRIIFVKAVAFNFLMTLRLWIH